MSQDDMDQSINFSLKPNELQQFYIDRLNPMLKKNRNYLIPFSRLLVKYASVIVFN